MKPLRLPRIEALDLRPPVLTVLDTRWFGTGRQRVVFVENGQDRPRWVRIRKA